jgi:hypothetical protein
MLKALILNFLMLLHPTHVTLTTIEQHQGSDTLTVLFRMYYDDFLNDLEVLDPEFKAGKTIEETVVPDNKLTGYFNDRFRITINRKLIKGELFTVSRDNLEIVMVLHFKSVVNPEKLTVVSKVLASVYSDQSNMIYLNINGYQDALELTPEHFTEKRNLK